MNINNFNLGSNFRAQQMQQNKLELNPEDLVKVKNEEVEVKQKPLSGTIIVTRDMNGNTNIEEIEDGHNVAILRNHQDGIEIIYDADSGNVTHKGEGGNTVEHDPYTARTKYFLWKDNCNY